MTASALSETLNRSHISARQVKSCRLCMLAPLADGENSKELDVVTALSLYAVACEMEVDG